MPRTCSPYLIAALIGFTLACSLITSWVEMAPARRERSAAAPLFLRVCADRAWTDSGLDLEAGRLLTIEYLSGEWSPWPGGRYDALGFGGDPRCDCNVIPGVSHAALIARIGEGEPFLVGMEYVGRVAEAGRLYLGINDRRLEDNSGCIRTMIEIQK